MDQTFLICLTFRLRLSLGLRLSKAMAYRKLKVADQSINEEKEALKQAQDTDQKLDSIRRGVECKNVTVSLSGWYVRRTSE